MPSWADGEDARMSERRGEGIRKLARGPKRHQRGPSLPATARHLHAWEDGACECGARRCPGHVSVTHGGGGVRCAMASPCPYHGAREDEGAV